MTNHMSYRGKHARNDLFLFQREFLSGNWMLETMCHFWQSYVIGRIIAHEVGK